MCWCLVLRQRDQNKDRVLENIVIRNKKNNILNRHIVS